jgi:hypothetical protein
MRSTTTRSTSTPGSPEAPARLRRSRAAALLAGAVLTALVLAGCNVPVEQWVPDFNGDGQITQNEVDWRAWEIRETLARSVETQRRSVQQHPFLTCIRRHESDRGAWPHINGYGADNPSSSASGAYQFLDSTWRNVSSRAGHPGYARAKFAPWYVQDAVTLWVYEHGGRSNWAGSGC